MSSSKPDRTTLLDRYKSLIDTDLPLAANSRSPSQPIWPVHLNHCFGRIILDNICQRPWREVIRAPAVKHMNLGQLERAVKLGEEILSGEADLGQLNRESLSMRGRAGEPVTSTTSSSFNRKRKTGQEVVAGRGEDDKGDRKRPRTIQDYFKSAGTKP